MRIFVTVSLYVLARERGADAARAEFDRQLAAPGRGSMPCVRAIARLRNYSDVAVRVDLGGSSAAKMRSRAASAALEGMTEPGDVWLSIDDDVEATVDALRGLLEAAADPAPRAIIAPTWLRGLVSVPGQEAVPVVGVALDPEGLVRELAGGVRLAPALAGAFGLVAVNRAALQAAAAVCERFTDDDGAERFAFAHEMIADGRWWGEDLSFFRRLPPEVRVEALLTGFTSHAGHVLPLDKLGECTLMSLPGFGRANAVERLPDEPAAAGDEAAAEDSHPEAPFEREPPTAAEPLASSPPAAAAAEAPGEPPTDPEPST